jgi:hypothetical protein
LNIKRLKGIISVEVSPVWRGRKPFSSKKEGFVLPSGNQQASSAGFEKEGGKKSTFQTMSEEAW